MLRTKLSFFVLIVIAFTLSGCLKEHFSNLPLYYRGTKTVMEKVYEITAVNFGMRKGEDAYRVQFQIFTDDVEIKPEIIILRFKEGNDSTLWLDSGDRISESLLLKVKNNCATREDPAIEVCWTDQDVSIVHGDESVSYKLKSDRGPLGEERPPRDDEPMTLKEIVGRARMRNYQSAEEAIEVFQAKERMAEARGNLLPHFNMRDLIGVATDGPLGLIGAVGDLLPFVFPTHWNEWSQSNDLYQAEILSFATLLANEMNTVEGLSYAIHRDQEMLSTLDAELAELLKIEHAAKRLEERGALRPGEAAHFGLTIKSLEQDRRQLSALIAKQLAILAEAVDLSPIGKPITLAPIVLSNPAEMGTPDVGESIEEIKKRSPELGMFYFLQRAALTETGQKKFGFLDPRSGDFFGAGYSHTIRIAAAELDKLKIRRLAMASGIERRAVEITEDMREAVDIYQIATTGSADLQHQWVRDFVRPLERGTLSLAQPGVLERMGDLHRRMIQFEASRLSSQHAYWIARSKWDRLLLEGFYEGLEVFAVPARSDGISDIVH